MDIREQLIVIDTRRPCDETEFVHMQFTDLKTVVLNV